MIDVSLLWDEQTTDPLEVLVDVLQNQYVESARAVATAADIRLRSQQETEPTDAILVHAEHVDGESVDVFLPYRKKRFRGVELGERRSELTERVIFS